MKTENVTKVIISEEDILTLIKNHLIKSGLTPINDIKLNLDVKDISSTYDRFSNNVPIIRDTLIECKKL